MKLDNPLKAQNQTTKAAEH